MFNQEETFLVEKNPTKTKLQSWTEFYINNLEN